MKSAPTQAEIQIQAQHALIERLRLSEKRYYDLVNGLSSVVFSIDEHAVITFVNDAGSRLIGIPKSDLQGLNLCTFLLCADSNLTLKEKDIVPTIKNRKKECKCKIVTLSSEVKWLNYSAQLDLESDSISGVMHDITMEVLLEKERQALTQTRNNFFSGMSHDLRTPINGTIVASELIMEATEGELSKYAESIRSSSKHLLGIVDDILDYSKAEVAQMNLFKTNFDLSKEVATTVEVFRPLCKKKNVDLIFEMEKIPSKIHTDLKRLKQILNNLLSNASKFTRSGEIKLSMRAQVDGKKGVLHFTLTDTGIGIPPEKIPDIFKPFKQVDDSIQKEFGGTGLGLSLTQELVKLMGGEISVKSECGKGTQFEFTIDFDLPRSSVSDKLRLVETRDNSHVRVMIVEDDTLTSMLLSTMLIKHHGFKESNIIVAASGSEMREKMNDTPMEMVYMDCNLPDSNGTELLAELRAHLSEKGHPAPFVVYSTASTGEREANLILESNPDVKAIKPITTDKLVCVLNEYYATCNSARL